MSIYQYKSNTEIYDYQLKVIAYDNYISSLELFLITSVSTKREGQMLFHEIKRAKRERKKYIKKFTDNLKTEYNEIHSETTRKSWNLREFEVDENGSIETETLLSPPLFKSKD